MGRSRYGTTPRDNVQVQVNSGDNVRAGSAVKQRIEGPLYSFEGTERLNLALVYPPSKESEVCLLTIDAAFLDFLRDNGLPIDSVLTPGSFKRLVRSRAR